MKKFLLVLLLACANYMAFSAATVAQREWRWRKDNGSESSATWASDQDVALTKGICDTAENIRLRMVFLVFSDPTKPNDAANKAVNWHLSYSTSSNGTFIRIPSIATSEHFTMSESAYEVNDMITSAQLSSSGGVSTPTYRGRFIDSNRTNGNITFTTPGGQNTLIEHEWVIRATAHAQAQTYYFKLEGLESYPNSLPQLTFGSVLGTTVAKDVTCNGNANGEIDLQLSGASSPYSYDWGNSITSEDLIELDPGTYDVTITDKHGCTGTNTATIEEPSAISVSVVQETIGCTGSNGGSAKVTASGGTGSLSYSWAPSGGTDATASNLAPDTYTVTVTDENNCSDSKTVTITEQSCTAVRNASDVSTEVRLFPNPSAKEGMVSVNTSGNLNIEKITLSNAQGKVMTVSNEKDLMIQHLEAGVYIVEIITDKGLAVKKLIIQ